MGRFWIRALLPFALVLATIAAAEPAAAVVKVGPAYPEKQLTFYVKATGATSGGYVTLKSDANSVAQYTPPEAALYTGVAAHARTNVGLAGDSFVFPLDVPLDRTYHLNLSRGVTGRLYWTSTTSTAEWAMLRTEICSGTPGDCVGSKIAQTGTQRWCAVGLDCCAAGVVCTDAWRIMGIGGRPEVLNLTEGSKLYLKVTRLGGSGDLTIGTGGNYASSFTFHYFDTDPLTIPSFARDGDYYIGLEPPTPPAAATQVSLGPALLALLGILGIARREAHGRSAIVLSLVLLAGAFAGCMGDKAEPRASATRTTTDGPQTTETHQEREDLVERGIGEIRGVIHDSELEVPVRSVFVSLLDTSHAMETQDNGTFWFTNLTAGTYALRMSHDHYLDLEGTLLVKAGSVTWYNVTIRPRESSREAHRHDLWTAPRMLFYEATTTLGMGPDGQMLCVALYACEAEFPIQRGQPVLPGTVRLEVTLTWPALPDGPRELVLRAAPTFGGSVTLGPRASGDAFNVVFYPHLADPGHQTFTGWRFFVVHPAWNSLYYPLIGDKQWMAATPVTIKVYGYKGAVPREPRHVDHWAGSNEISLFKNKELIVNNFHDHPSHATSWKVQDAKKRVPVGAKEIRGKLTWTVNGGHPDLMNTQWMVGYKGATDIAGRGEIKRATEVSRSSGSMDFRIEVKPEEADQFYQQGSYWTFHIDDRSAALAPSLLGQPPLGVSTYPFVGMTFSLTATVYKDPDWVDRGNR